MVECESLRGQINNYGFGVLIDTWWNVNINVEEPPEWLVSVLIDTWWNVNQKTIRKKQTQENVLIDTWWNVND